MRKYLIGVSVGLVSALAFSSVASAAVTNLGFQATIAPAKQDKKVRGPITATVVSTDTHAGALPCPLGTANTNACSAFPPSIRSLIVFPTDFRFNPGTNSRLPDCNLASLVGKSTAGAIAACPKSVVGSGSNVQRFSDGRILNGTITAFNGQPSGGNPSMYLHIEFPGVETKPILNGVIRGNVFDVQIPPVQGSVIDQFTATIRGRTVTAKKGKRKTFYLSAKCSKGTWASTETVTYQNGQQLTASTSDTCKKKKK